MTHGECQLIYVVHYRLKYLSKIENGSTPNTGVVEYWNGEIKWATPVDVSNAKNYLISDTGKKITKEGFDSCGTTLVEPSSIILTTRAPIGNVAMAGDYICTNQGCKAIHLLKANHSYLFYQLLVSKGVLESLGSGSTFKELSTDALKSFLVCLPSNNEQTTIADYLDNKTGQIDDLIAKKQKLIDLLDEEKTAIINQAVTKGLDPNSPMKDSGIPSLGEIPAHWHMKKIKHVLLRKRTALKTGPFGSQLKTTDFVLNGRYKVYNQRNVLDDDFDLGDDFIDDQKFRELKEFEIFPSDILITTRGTIGKCAIFPSKKRDGVLHPCLIRIQVDEGIVLKDWITNYINNSSLFLSAVLLESNATTIDVIYGTDLKEIVIPVPNDLREQRDVLEYINNQLLRIRETTSKINKEIELLQEYRTALISEAVTGKIDVRRQEGPGHD